FLSIAITSFVPAAKGAAGEIAVIPASNTGKSNSSAPMSGFRGFLISPSKSTVIKGYGVPALFKAGSRTCKSVEERNKGLVEMEFESVPKAFCQSDRVA